MKRSAKHKIDDQTILKEILSLSKQIQLLGKIDVDFLSESEFRVLDALCANKKSLFNMKQVSEKTNLPPSILSKAANALEEKGYVGRLHSRRDRRQVNIKITEAGANVLKEYHKRRMQRLRSIVRNLTDYEREVICEGIGIFQDTISKIRKK